MKKTLILFAAFLLVAQVSFADSYSSNTNSLCNKDCKQYEIEKGCNEKTKCTDTIKQDNKCFFDNEFKEMKRVLCLSPEQNKKINCIYDRYKGRMGILHSQASARQKKLCKLINECGDKYSIKEEKQELKEIRNEAKEQYKCFIKEVKQELCKDQKRSLNRFNRQEKRKMKKLAKYCVTPKFPCSTGCGCACPSNCDCGCQSGKPCTCE